MMWYGKSKGGLSKKGGLYDLKAQDKLPYLLGLRKFTAARLPYPAAKFMGELT